MAKQIVTHLQIYRRGPFGGEVNTTICGRVRNGSDYNNTQNEAEVTCKFCISTMKAMRLKAKKGWAS